MAKKMWIAIVIVVGLLLFWFAKSATKPLPGEFITDQGRNHITDIYGVTYSSNPPTSGPHFPTWAGRGVYNQILSDGYLIHSLEHGYVVISYDCSKLNISRSIISEIYAHDEESLPEEATESQIPLMHMKFLGNAESQFFTPSNPPEKEVDLPQEFESESCKNLVQELSTFASDKRIIVVPRINMETPIALTAWTHIQKLTSVDKESISFFISSFENKGPEKTME